MSDLQICAEAVRVIKEAILRSQYRAASAANKEQLSLYYGIGCYVSKNSREGFWGKGAIEAISQQLQKELPGLRGFSAVNIKFMRQFYETWCEDLKSLTVVSEIDTQLLFPCEISQKEDFDITSFLGLGFTHHMIVLLLRAVMYLSSFSGRPNPRLRQAIRRCDIQDFG